MIWFAKSDLVSNNKRWNPTLVFLHFDFINIHFIWSFLIFHQFSYFLGVNRRRLLYGLPHIWEDDLLFYLHSHWRAAEIFPEASLIGRATSYFLLDSKTTNRPDKDYKSQDAQQALTLTFVLRLIDAKQGLADPAHTEPGPDPKTNAQEDVWGNLETTQKVMLLIICM